MKTNEYLPYLDGWRGLAIIAVLLSHFAFFKGVWWMGEFGVQLFFVLSGYLMGGLLFIKKVELPDFFARRFNRVFPTLWVFIAVMAVYAGLQPMPHNLTLTELASVLTFTRTYLGDTSVWAREWPIGHLWSLAVEEHSYVFLAIGAFIVRGRSRFAAPAFLALAVLTVVTISFVYQTKPPAGHSPWYLRSEAAALGLLAAAAYRVTAVRFTWMQKSHPMLLLAAFVVAALCYSVYSHKGLQYTLAPLLLAYVINNLSMAPNVVHAALSNKALRWFGLCSFSLYLWQQPFYYAYQMSLMNLWVAMAGAILTGGASFYLLEDPARLYLNRAWANRKSVVVPTADVQPLA